ncbi:MAG: 30S ribosomal protein S16, partial [Flammeovirgaceae bacterium]
AKLAEWLKVKQDKIQATTANVGKAKLDAAKARKEAESKVREARAEAIRKKQEVAAAVPAAEATEAPIAEPQA